MEKKINGKLFIIPNAPYTKEELGWYDPKNWDKWAENAQSQLNNFGLTVEEPMIQVWATNEDCDNFADHCASYCKMIGTSEEAENDNRFPTHLPYSLLKDLKEGETITLRLKNGVTLELTASQTTTRYSRFGSFEEVLASLV